MDRKKLVDESIGYIMRHLDEDLSLDVLSSRFFISKYHFSRIFREETGETVYSFIKRCRIDQSAIDMKLEPARTMTDIGLDYGYSASNYSSAFKKRFHASPVVFKRSLPIRCTAVPFAPERVVRFKTAEEYAARIELRELEDLFVIYQRLIGNYGDLEKSWRQFIDQHGGSINKKTILLERFYHDPAITASSQCVCDICRTSEQERDAESVMRIRGGKWIVYPFDGEIRDIYGILQGIFSIWLPQSGYKMTRRYGLNIYRRVDWENHSVAMDLCIPVS